MLKLRKAEERGHFDHGWLDTWHTFSFADYYDRDHMGFSVLRVINQDRVVGGAGFGTHPHRDMEIITYVLEGALEHRDSMGNGSIIRPGEVQRMSAGTGITHSERNHSKSAPVHLLQIWILPSKQGLQPSYEQKTFSEPEKLGVLRVVASPDGRDGSVTVHQDVTLRATILNSHQSVDVENLANRKLWIQLARGEVTVGDVALRAGDGLAITGAERLQITGVSAQSELLAFDLP